MVFILNIEEGHFKGKRLSIYLHYFSQFFFLNWALNTWMIELLRILLDTCNNDLIKYISVYGTIAQHIYISALGPGNNSYQSANVYCQTWNPISNCEDAFNQKHLKETNKKKFYKNTLGANLIPNQYRFQNALISETCQIS